MKSRIVYAVGIFLLCGLFLFSPVHNIGNTEDFPTRPVEVIIAFAPGGAVDLAVRVMGDELTKSMGVPVILTNKAGGGGAVGAEYVARAKPDGYTILAAPQGIFTMLPFLAPDLHYKLSDFIPLCNYGAGPAMVLVRKDSPFRSFEELMSYAKKNPGKLTCATPGTGTSSHFTLELLKIETGIDVAHMPYKSGGEVVTSLLGGQVDFAFQGISSALGLLKSGDFRALASLTFDRMPGFPDIPTLKELGYPKVIIIACYGYFLPKGTPKPVVDNLASVFEKTITNPTVKRKIEDLSNILLYQDGPTYAKFIAEEYKTLDDLAKKAKLIK
jgi:tripartite-type tricarboxylate transporter receptor subunit TctC